MLPETIALHELIDVVITTLDARDPYTFEHSFRVALYSEIIAREMGLSKTICQNIHIAAHLHDIGKIGVPDAILNKTGRLTTDEQIKMQAHSHIGANILNRIIIFQEISNIVLYHHERFDGLGYPTGIKGENIPLESRIISVADSFDAMTSDRPYRKAMPPEDAFNKINQHVYQQFCPIVIQYFHRAFEQFRLQIKILNNTNHYALYELFNIDHENLMHSKKI